MVTFKGALRTAGRVSRQMDRSNQRYLRELSKQMKEQQKQQEIVNATQAVKDYQNYVDALKGFHKTGSSGFNWQEVKSTPEPIQPSYNNQYESAAQKRLDNYKPGFFGKLFGNPENTKDDMLKGVHNSRKRDQELYEKALVKYKSDIEEFKQLQKICQGVENKDVEMYHEAISYYDPFADMAEIGNAIDFELNPDRIDASLVVIGTDIIPNYELKQTSTGKLSKKAIPIGKFNELYQDHVCSAALRISGDIFSFFPVDWVRVNIFSNLLNSQTGFMENTLILSVVIPRTTFIKLNLTHIDPSESMANFIYAMNFKKTTGFTKIEQVEFPQ